MFEFGVELERFGPAFPATTFELVLAPPASELLGEAAPRDVADRFAVSFEFKGVFGLRETSGPAGAPGADAPPGLGIADSGRVSGENGEGVAGG
jgi:hypothetical protein